MCKEALKDTVMTTWKIFAEQAPELADFGKTRLLNGVAYLGTIRSDGSARVHPVTPIIGDELFLFMEPTSPKRKDLHRDPRYTLHCSVENSNGGEGEFYVRGKATLIDNPDIRAQAVQTATYSPKERYILFVLSVEFAFMNTYDESGPNPKRWQVSS
jgi:hypothetical protein